MAGRQLILDIHDAFSSIRRRPLRSLLSSLGVGIGVMALIAMLSISEGAKQQALEKISSLGTDTLRIEDGTLSMVTAERDVTNISDGLTFRDSTRIQAWLDGRGELGAYERRGERLVVGAQRSVNATVMAVNPAWFQAERLTLSWGRIFDTLDLKSANTFAVVGARIGRELNLRPGSALRIGRESVTVIGALAPRGSLLTEGTGLSTLDFDSAVLLPLQGVDSGGVLTGYGKLDGLVIRLSEGLHLDITATASQLENLLLTSHRDIRDFTIVVPFSLIEEARHSQRIFGLVMGAIAGLSLLVGGIGVMNVMLANISEQTREIGLRMSLGASRLRIVWLYLWHAMLLTLSGSVWGIAGGMVLAYVIQLYAGWHVAYSGVAMTLAPLAAVITGLVFGLHPALRAAELDPAAALREV